MIQQTTGLCEQTQSLLLVVDVQTRLMAAMSKADRNAVIKGSQKLLRAAELLAIPTVVTEQYPRGLGHTEPALLKQLPAVCERLEKTAFSVRGVAEFDKLLAMSHRQQVVICGVEAHVCVLQTALQLHNDGFEVFLASDAICSRSATNTSNTLARLSAKGIVVSNVESILFEWLRDSTHPAFRDISALVQ